MRIIDMLKQFLGISGHNTERAKAIATIAEESTQQSRELNDQLRGYANQDDPFKAMVIDLSNRRAEVLMASPKWHRRLGDD